MNKPINTDALLFALSEECPLYGGNPKECPLHDLRKESLLERLSLIAALSEEEKREMVEQHEHCLFEDHSQTEELE